MPDTPRSISVSRDMAFRAALVIGGALLLVAAAKVKVPFYPVPMTLQTLVPPLLGLALGARAGAAPVVLYLVAGLAGAPVFTNTPPAVPGLAYFVGPTAGYLVAMPLGAWIAGTLGRALPGPAALRFSLAALISNAFVIGTGAAWLAYGAQMASGATGIGLAAAWSAGVLPFILGDVVKALCAAALAAAAAPRFIRR